MGHLCLGNNTTTGSVAGNIVINEDNSQGASLNFYRSNEYTYSGIISGTGTVFNIQSKTILTGANTYTGNTIILGGTLQIGNGISGSVSNSGVELNPGATLRFEPGEGGMTFSEPISGLGNVEYAGSYSKALYLTGDNTFIGATTIFGGYLYIGKGGSTGNIKGNIIGNGIGSWVRFYRNNYTYPGIISGNCNVGIFANTTLSGIHTYTGETYIDDFAELILTETGTIESSSHLRLQMEAKFDVSSDDKKIKRLSGIHYSNEVNLGSKHLTIGNSNENDGEGDFEGSFSGTGGVTKTGKGTFTMLSPSVATGAFYHAQGTVVLNGITWRGQYITSDISNIIVNRNCIIEGNMSLWGGTINMDLTATTPPKLTILGTLFKMGSVSNISITTNTPQTNYVLIEARAGITDTELFKATIAGGTYKPILSINSPTQLLLTTENVGIEEITNDELQISVYPNPTTGELRVKSEELRVESVEVFDMMGKRHLSLVTRHSSPVTCHSSLVTCHSSLVTINISHLQNGVYFLRIETEQGIITKKVIKN
jgi:autotransporter-associated beta strand protein